MKFIAIASCILGYAATAAAAPDINAWVRPLLGVHALEGDPTCRKLSIEHSGGDTAPDSYTVYTVSDGSHEALFTNVDGATLKGSALSYKHEDQPDMPCGDRRKTTITLEKDESGKLGALSFKTSHASGCIYFWHQDFSVNCKR